jgi:hypothetical protein
LAYYVRVLGLFPFEIVAFFKLLMAKFDVFIFLDLATLKERRGKKIRAWHNTSSRKTN